MPSWTAPSSWGLTSSIPRTCMAGRRARAKRSRSWGAGGRRVVAAVYDADRVKAETVGFENHLNYFHRRSGGIDLPLARGLAAFLNSTLVDAYFRQFNGHTQVNATDLRSLKYPTRAQLIAVGAKVGDAIADQERVDRAVAEELW